MEPQEYLQPDFDPAKVTVPTLRSILLDQNVKYPSSAKKADLVELFDQEIKPKREVLLSKYVSPIASTEGIIFMDEDQLKTRKTSRKTSRKVSKTRKTSKSRKSSRKTSKALDASKALEETPPPTSPFSEKNVFQKSPDQLIPQKRSSPGSSKKLKKRTRVKSEQVGSGSDSGTPTPKKTNDEIYVATPTGLKSPTKSAEILDHYNKSVNGGKIKKRKVSYSSDEETVHGSDDEVVYKRVSVDKEPVDYSSDTDVEDAAKLKENIIQTEVIELEETSVAKEVSLDLLNLLARTLVLLGVLAFGLTFYAYRTIKLDAGYCGQPSVDFDLWSAVPTSLQSELIHPYVSHLESFYVSNLPHDCTPCPDHGTCDGELVCDDHYKKTLPAKALLGLIPLEATCEFDTYEAARLQALTEYTIQLLGRHDGQLSLNDFKIYLKATKPDHMSDDEFEEYWSQFITTQSTMAPEIEVDLLTDTISIVHATPSQFLTGFGEIRRKTRHLFSTAEPTAT